MLHYQPFSKQDSLFIERRTDSNIYESLSSGELCLKNWKREAQFFLGNQ